MLLTEERADRLARLRRCALQLATESDEGITLGELLEELQRIERSDALISEALAGLQSTKRLHLTPGRRMVRGTNTA